MQIFLDGLLSETFVRAARCIEGRKHGDRAERPQKPARGIGMHDRGMHRACTCSVCIAHPQTDTLFVGDRRYMFISIRSRIYCPRIPTSLWILIAWLIGWTLAWLIVDWFTYDNDQRPRRTYMRRC